MTIMSPELKLKQKIFALTVIINKKYFNQLYYCFQKEK